MNNCASDFHEMLKLNNSRTVNSLLHRFHSFIISEMVIYSVGIDTKINLFNWKYSVLYYRFLSHTHFGRSYLETF